MLKNLDPLLTGQLLTILDEMEPGEWLALTAGPSRSMAPNEGHTVVNLPDVAVESAAQALLSVLPLDHKGAPIAYLDETAGVGELPDVAFAICGIAADAELRRVPMSNLDAREFRAIAVHAAATVRTSRTAEPSAFLLRKGELTAA